MRTRGLMTLVLIGALALGVGQAWAQPVATRILLLTPFGPAGPAAGLTITSTASGDCFTGSLASPERPDAWRCMAGNAILDPCFQDVMGPGHELACVPTPFETGAVLLTLTSELPEPETPTESDYLAGQPWALELANGARCTALTGATAPVAGLRINYGCEGGGQVIGPIDRSSRTWRALYQGASDALILELTDVETAWF